MARTAFVTGATGFLGTNLVEQLHGQGWTVHALHRKTSNLAPLDRYGVRWAEGDILDEASLRQAIPEGADAVFHVAANISMWAPHRAQQWQQNVVGTQTVLKVAQEKAAGTFVYTSSWASWRLRDGAINEDTPQQRPRRHYGLTKHVAEQSVREAADNGRVVIINPSHIIGRYDRGGWGRMFQMVHTGKLPGVPPGSGSFCHAEQVAKAQIAAVDQAESGHNYLLGGTDATFLEVVHHIGHLLGKEVPRKPLPGWILKTAAQVKDKWSRVTRKEPDITPDIAANVTHHPRIQSDKAETTLGYQAVALEDMLADAHRWMVHSGHLTPA